MTKRLAPDGSEEYGNKDSSAKRNKRSNPRKFWSFTWNNYGGSENSTFIAFRRALDERGAIYRIQEEIGASGTIHLQGYVEFKTKLRPRETPILKTEGIMWSETRNKEAALNYCMKEETATGLFWTNIIKETFIDYLERPIMQWMAQLEELLKRPQNTRDIFWIFETQGGVGKTSWARSYTYHNKPKVLYVMGKIADISYGIAKNEEKNPFGTKVIIYDLPRATNLKNFDYTKLEQIKNGIMFNTKYESGMLIPNPPHLVIFANVMPEFGKLSRDRWHCYEIQDNKLFRVLPP